MQFQEYIDIEKQSAFHGLTAAEVKDRIAAGQVNHYELHVGRSYWQIIRDNILNIFNILLFVMLLIVLISQDYLTVLFAGTSVVTTSIMGTVQELNARRKLHRLARLSALHVVVWRDGKQLTIDEQDIVKDDHVIITPGNRLAVDGHIVYSDSLEIDESHLTGESDAINKEVGDPVYSGSFCIAGSGVMVATEVGENSTINKLSTIARIYTNTLTPTQRHIATIIQFALVILFVFGPMVFISGHLIHLPFLDIVRNTLVFSTSLVAQGLILSIMLSFTVGAIKMTRHKTLIQRINAVESMANVSVLCFDKTGTLTQNKLRVVELIPAPGYDLQAVENLLHVHIGNLSHQNSTIAAITRYLAEKGASPAIPVKVREIPFNAARRWGAVGFDDHALILGAPEQLLAVDDTLMEEMTRRAGQGLRVLAFGRTQSPLVDGRFSGTVEPLALVTVRDQVREGIQETLAAFHDLDVKLKIISGDHPDTVQAVANEAGLVVNSILTGAYLDSLGDTEFAELVYVTDAFARVEPMTKRRILASLRKRGEYVAMVGDGVNDVPALKEADLAIAMNEGAQISKDIADIVLLNNALSTLPLAFHEGTEITQTIFGTTKMFLTKNFFNTFQFIFSLLMTLPFPISPIQISWVAFGTVNVPAGLMSLGLLRPQKMKNFRDDVLDYIITVGFTGAVSISLLYLVTMSYLDSNLILARSTVTLFSILFGLMIAWDVHGIDFLRPQTLTTRWRGLFVTTLLTGGAVLAASLLPKLFDFRRPPPEIMFLTVVVFLLCMAISRFGIRHRGLLHHIYSLFRR